MGSLTARPPLAAGCRALPAGVWGAPTLRHPLQPPPIFGVQGSPCQGVGCPHSLHPLPIVMSGCEPKAHDELFHGEPDGRFRQQLQRVDEVGSLRGIAQE
jgi:hypothetical protein